MSVVTVRADDDDNMLAAVHTPATTHTHVPTTLRHPHDMPRRSWYTYNHGDKDVAATLVYIHGHSDGDSDDHDMMTTHHAPLTTVVVVVVTTMTVHTAYMHTWWRATALSPWMSHGHHAVCYHHYYPLRRHRRYEDTVTIGNKRQQ